MKIIDYRPDHLAELTRIYNELALHVPHCYPIADAQLASAIAGDCGLESHGQRLTAETVFVAIEKDEPLGFVHVGEALTKETSGEAGVVRFLAYPRGRRDVGQTLLARAEDWLRGRKQTTVIVFPQAYRYPFYAFPHAFISNHLEHVQALLFFNGYHASNGEVFLDWPDFEPEQPGDVVDLDYQPVAMLEPSVGQLPNITVAAFLDGQRIGVCELLSASEFSRQPEMEEVAFCMWLGIEEPFQGKRLGRILLGGALVEAKKAGYRHAAISTAWDNHRALLFYANHGFRAVDWTRQFRRDLAH